MYVYDVSPQTELVQNQVLYAQYVYYRLTYSFVQEHLTQYEKSKQEEKKKEGLIG